MQALPGAHAERIVGQKPRERQQGRARELHQGSEGVGENVLEPRAPALAPEALERGDGAGNRQVAALGVIVP